MKNFELGKKDKFGVKRKFAGKLKLEIKEIGIGNKKRGEIKKKGYFC